MNEDLLVIDSADPSSVMNTIVKYGENMRDPAIGAAHVMWITDPANLTKIHTELINKLGIPAKLMSIRRGNYSRTRKAVMLVQAMEFAVKRVHKL
jgi:hypothetical protein